jgi:hypothetical protein
MIVMKFVSAGLLGMIAASALAQAPAMDPGATRSGEPSQQSNKASNIVSADTNGTVAPNLPSAGLGLDATARDYLRTAREALVAGRTGEAQQSLEMAETRVLGGAVTPNRADIPSGRPKAVEIHDALHALGQGDRALAIQIVDIALNN